MKYNQDQLKNALSPEFVLGTLSGRARLRYQRLLMEHKELQKNVWQWESKLNELGTVMTPQQPDARVWRAIEKRLGFIEKNEDNTEPWWHHLWTPGFALASIFMLVTAWLLMTQKQLPIELPAERVAVVQNSNAEALWLIEVQTQNLRIHATDKLPPLNDQDYQLWMIAKDGRPPIPLGLLPQNGMKEIPRSILFNQLDIAALAVSIEPLGGSPNGQPTTVLFTTELVQI